MSTEQKNIAMFFFNTWILFGILSILDIWTTYFGVKYLHVSEVHPLIVYLMSKFGPMSIMFCGVVVQLLTAFAFTVSTIYWNELKIVRLIMPKVAIILLVSKLFVVFSNLFMIFKHWQYGL